MRCPRPGSGIRVFADSKPVLMAALDRAVEMGGHCLCLCGVDRL